MEAIIERLPSPVVAVPLILVVLYSLYSRLTAESTTPQGAPWIGKDSTKHFAETRAAISSFNNVREWLAEGYEKYSKHGKAYIFPDFSGRPELLLPRSQMQWLLEQPDSVLSTSGLHYDVLQGDYAFTEPKILEDPYHEHVVHKSLARRIPMLIPHMWEELVIAVEHSWGVDTQSWNSICVFDNLMYTIPRITNRMLVGLPLCRKDDFLSNMGKFATDVITAATVILPLTPRWLHPIVGRLCTIPNNYHFRNTTKYSVPLIEERLANFKRKQEDPSFEWEPPNDYISWHIAIATAENRYDELTPRRIAQRLMPINFAAIHTTVLTLTNCFFDLLSTDPALHYLDGIREEVERALAEEGGQWTKAGLAKCHRTDSAIRESMRISNFMTRGVMRKVLSDAGIENKSQGWRAPKGAYVGFDVHSVQHDPQIYPEPETYDAFRFSRPREDAEAGSDGTAKSKLVNTGIVHTSDTFLPFGHGRHACPGRFFVSLEMKMMLAYMVMNYDVELLPTRPPNTWFGQNNIPPMKAKIRVRRKVGTTPA